MRWWSMQSHQPPSSTDARPPWWRLVVGVIAGVGAGGIAFLVALWPITFLLDQLVGRSEWEAALKASPEIVMILLRSVFWTIPFALGQWFSALISGWSKAIYIAAAVQTFHMVSMFPIFEVAYLWVLPFLIAGILAKLNWASSAAEKGRIREAKAAGAHDEA